MTSITISPGNAQDVETFEEAEWAQFNIDRGEEADFSKEEFCYIAKDKSKIIGFAIFDIQAGVGHLERLLVKKNYRDKGIGKELILFFEEKCKKQGCHKLWLKTCPSMHTKAFSVYKKLGYTTENVQKNDYLGFDWHMMVKFL